MDQIKLINVENVSEEEAEKYKSNINYDSSSTMRRAEIE